MLCEDICMGIAENSHLYTVINAKEVYHLNANRYSYSVLYSMFILYNEFLHFKQFLLFYKCISKTTQVFFKSTCTTVNPLPKEDISYVLDIRKI